MAEDARANRYKKPQRSRSKDNEQLALYDLAKLVGDELWERAKRVTEELAPEVPADTEEVPPFDKLMILELAALDFAPQWWDDPDALEDLYRLKKQIRGRDMPWLKDRAQRLRKIQRGIPDPRITPQSPEWDKMMRRIKRAS